MTVAIERIDKVNGTTALLHVCLCIHPRYERIPQKIIQQTHPTHSRNRQALQAHRTLRPIRCVLLIAGATDRAVALERAVEERREHHEDQAAKHDPPDG